MKSSLHILIVLILLPLGSTAQETRSELDFYVSLALKDAKVEQNTTALNIEDEKDFWADQLQFEKALRVKSPEAYKAYLSGKHIAYARHQKECQGHEHSAFYYQRASYYAVNGSMPFNSEAVLSAQNVTKSKKAKSLEVPD